MFKVHPLMATILFAAAITLAVIGPRTALCQEEGAQVATQPGFMPQLSFEQRPTRGEGDDRIFTMAQISIPKMDDFRCEVWCYEMATFGTGEADMQEDGSLLITHTHSRETMTLKTHLVPEPGAVTFNIEISGPDPEQVRNVGHINPCWQLGASDAFGNRGDYYYDFASRCFIYTVRGFTLFKDTTRFPHPRSPLDSKQNVPPWTQGYLPIWCPHPGQGSGSGSGHSSDRPIYSIVGSVSRDGKYLTALGWPKVTWLSNAWHSCMHAHPALAECYDPETNRIVCHGKFYFMQNDPEALLAKYLADFPQPEPALDIQPTASGTLQVTHRGLPGQPLELTGLPQEWQQQPWGTWKSTAEGPSGPITYRLRPYDEFANFYMSVRNDTAEPFQIASVPHLEGGEGWEIVPQEVQPVLFSTQDGWVAGLALERICCTIPAGQELTVRGRLRVFEGTPEELRELVNEDLSEWQRTRPFRLPIEDE